MTFLLAWAACLAAALLLRPGAAQAYCPGYWCYSICFAGNCCQCWSIGAGSCGACLNPCTAGTFDPSAAQGSCDACPSGAYSLVTGAATSTVCTACAGGTYSSLASATACTSCVAGSYVAGSYGLSVTWCNAALAPTLAPSMFVPTRNVKIIYFQSAVGDFINFGCAPINSIYYDLHAGEEGGGCMCVSVCMCVLGGGGAVFSLSLAPPPSPLIGAGRL
jgi:hypothetical protein